MAVRGWVYVLSNKAMPGLVKIGFSTKDPVLRVAELDGTGLPYPFDIEYDVLILDPRETEQNVHRRLATYREAKEFFRVESRLAIQTIRESIEFNGKTLISEKIRNGTPIEQKYSELSESVDQTRYPKMRGDHKPVMRRYANSCPVCNGGVTGKDSRCPKCFAFLS